jgi:hypothetical protein
MEIQKKAKEVQFWRLRPAMASSSPSSSKPHSALHHLRQVDSRVNWAIHFGYHVRQKLLCISLVSQLSFTIICTKKKIRQKMYCSRYTFFFFEHHFPGFQWKRCSRIFTQNCNISKSCTIIQISKLSWNCTKVDGQNLSFFFGKHYRLSTAAFWAPGGALTGGTAPPRAWPLVMSTDYSLKKKKGVFTFFKNDYRNYDLIPKSRAI